MTQLSPIAMRIIWIAFIVAGGFWICIGESVGTGTGRFSGLDWALLGFAAYGIVSTYYARRQALAKGFLHHLG